MRASFQSAIVILLILTEYRSAKGDHISHNTVKSWANKLSVELSQLSQYVTRYQKVYDSYRHAEAKPRDGNALAQEIAKAIKDMMESKISALKRIMNAAETLALAAPAPAPAPANPTELPEYIPFVDAKNNTVNVSYSAHFDREVNLTMSAVHVPTNVYSQAQNVIRAIKWSEELDETFIKNYEQDPSLSWQFFGSATGFMRHYPAFKWSSVPVDLFDCRTRSWYIEAATSPKDILFLVDNSGSMIGLRQQIAKHVVSDILDTLGNNDYVNIMRFSNVTVEVSSGPICFEGKRTVAVTENVPVTKL